MFENYTRIAVDFKNDMVPNILFIHHVFHVKNRIWSDHISSKKKRAKKTDAINSRWWFHPYFWNFHPENLGKISNLMSIYFQMGWEKPPTRIWRPLTEVNLLTLHNSLDLGADANAQADQPVFFHRICSEAVVVFGPCWNTKSVGQHWETSTGLDFQLASSSLFFKYYLDSKFITLLVLSPTYQLVLLA